MTGIPGLTPPEPDPHEFDGWLFEPGERAPMSRPPTYQAAKPAIEAVSDALARTEADPTAMADWLVNLMERYGSRSAEPVVDMEGNGPKCSWCGAIWPLCGHHLVSAVVQ